MNETPTPPTAPPRKTTNRVLLFVGVPLLLLLGIAAGYFLFIHEIEEPVTEADRAVLVTVEQLAKWLDEPPAGKQTVRRVRTLDGTRDLEYEYESPPDSDESLYLNCLVSFQPKPSDAITVYGAQRIGLSIGLKLNKEVALRLVDQKNPFSWGDQSSSSVIWSGDTPVGNVFTGRKGKRVFHVMLVGPYLESAESVGELLSPVLARLEAYRL